MGERKPVAGHASISEAVRAFRARNPGARQSEIAESLGVSRSHVHNALAVSAGRKMSDTTLASRAGCIGVDEAGRTLHRDTSPPPTREVTLHLAESDYAALIEAARAAARTPAARARALLLAVLGRGGA